MTVLVIHVCIFASQWRKKKKIVQFFDPPKSIFGLTSWGEQYSCCSHLSKFIWFHIFLSILKGRCWKKSLSVSGTMLSTVHEKCLAIAKSLLQMDVACVYRSLRCLVFHNGQCTALLSALHAFKPFCNAICHAHPASIYLRTRVCTTPIPDTISGRHVFLFAAW